MPGEAIHEDLPPDLGPVLEHAAAKAQNEEDPGPVRSGLVAVSSTQLRRFLLAITTNCMVHVEWNNVKKTAFIAVPEHIEFPTRRTNNGGEALYHRLITRSLCTLTSAARTPADEVLRLLRTIVPGRDSGDHAGRDTQVHRVRDEAIAVEDDDDEVQDVVVVSESDAHRSVVDLIVDMDAQYDGRTRVVLLQAMEEFEVVSVGDDPMGCLGPHTSLQISATILGFRSRLVWSTTTRACSKALMGCARTCGSTKSKIHLRPPHTTLSFAQEPHVAAVLCCIQIEIRVFVFSNQTSTIFQPL